MHLQLNRAEILYLHRALAAYPTTAARTRRDPMMEHRLDNLLVQAEGRCWPTCALCPEDTRELLLEIVPGVSTRLPGDDPGTHLCKSCAKKVLRAIIDRTLEAV